MPTPNHPDDSLAQNGAPAPDLTWQNGDEPSGEQAGAQSIFSVRSGIQDPLVRVEPVAASSQTESDSATATEAVPEGPDSSSVEEEVAKPDRKQRGKQGRAKVIKSKRQTDRARRRQMNYLQERREKKKMRVFYNRIRLVVKLCFAVLWGVLLWEVLQAGWWIFNPAQFKLEQRQLVQFNQLKPLVSQWEGQPLYAVDTGILAQEIESRFEIVEQAVVRRSLFPPRLTVQLQEKQPWAEIYTSEKQTQPYGLMVSDGSVSLKNYHYRPATYQALNLTKLLAAPNTELPQAYFKQLREVGWQARQIPGLHLVNVDIRNPQKVILNYRETQVVLGKLNGTASTRLARLIPLLPKIQEYREHLQGVDLRWEEQVTFRKKPNVKLEAPQQAKVDG